MTTQEIFRNNLKAYRKQAGLTQAQLATYIDKSFNYINGIECGTSFPPPNVIDKIAEILKIKPIQLFSENGCTENIINSDKDEFINQLAGKVFNQIKDEIKNDIYEGLRKVLQ